MGRSALIALLLLTLLAATTAQPTGAHAALERSNPQANSVMPQSPEEIRLWFSEPIEQRESTIRLFDRAGNELPDIVAEPGDDANSMVARLPGPLDTGSYSVVWTVLSAADGHPLRGYFVFTVGTNIDIAPLTAPIVLDAGGAPLWLQSLARWFVLLALAVAVASWPVWLLVIWPATRNDAGRTRTLSARMQTLGLGAIVAALLSNLLMLGVQASFLERGSFASRVSETISDTRFGRLWLARIGLLLMLAVILRLVPWLDPLGRRFATAAGVIVSALLPVPVSMNAHASALDTGRVTAMAFDYVHMLTASLWFGGLVALSVVLLRPMRASVDRRMVLARAMPRFSAMALVCWGLLAITGLYAWWLQVGSWDALRLTGYGQSLLFKSIVVGLVLLIALANLFLITRKLADENARPRWVGRLGYAVLAEIVLAALILLAVGRMTSQQPGRDVIAAERAGQTVQFDMAGRNAILQLLPGAAGPNHFVVTIPGEPTPPDTVVLLRLTYAGKEIGSEQLKLGRTTLTTFETHGSELGIAGDWQIELLLRQPGVPDIANTQTVTLDLAGSAAPKAPWRFGRGGFIGLVLMTCALLGFVFAWRAGKGRLRMESAGLGVAAALLGLLVMVQGRIQPAIGYDPGLVNPIAATSDAVTRGEALYQTNCLSCHGAAGQGDGPLSAGMFPKPADFSAAHTRVHPDGQLFAWIENGKPGTDMPAFGEVLTDEQIWQVIDYIQVEFQGKPLVEATPSP